MAADATPGSAGAWCGVGHAASIREGGPRRTGVDPGPAPRDQRAGPRVDTAGWRWDARPMAAETQAARRPVATGLLEREPELEAISALLARARAGSGGLLLVEGPPGIGKSALLDRAAEIARDTGVDVLRARGRELERLLAWGVTRALLERRLRDEGVLSGPEAPARVLFGADAAPVEEAAAEVGFAIAHALYRLVVRLGEEAPLLLVVDDAHWADEPSLRFVAYLAGRLEEHPVAVIAGSRPGETGEESLVDVLAADPAAATRRIGPLGREAVAVLVRRDRPEAEEAFCQRCHELTGGNPLELRELLAALDPRRTAEPDALQAAVDVAAGSLGRSVLRRLDALPPAAQRLAHAVAVVDDEADPSLAAGLVGLSPDAALAAVDELEAADLVRSGEALGFEHPLLRAAVYGTLRYSERARLHRRAADLLVARGEPAERVAPHLLETAPAGDPGVVRTLRAAARRAIDQGAPASAARSLARALREPPADTAQGEVLAELGRAEALAGLADAPARLEAAVERCGDATERARLRLDLGRALTQARRLGDGQEVFRLALTEIGEEESDVGLDLQSGYLPTAMHVPELAADVRRRVAAILGSDAELTSRARRGLASKAMVGRLFAAEPYAETLALARRIFGDGRLVEEDRFDSQVLTHVISTLAWCDDLRTAGEALRLTFADAQRSGSSLAFAMASQMRARHRLWTGPTSEALADARTAVEVLRGGGLMYLHASAYSLVRALLERDEAGEGAAVLERGASGMRGESRSAWRHAARATLAAHRGDDEAALSAFLACGRRLERIAVLNPVVLHWRSEAGLAAHRLGRAEQARRLVGEELALPERFGAPRALSVSRLAAGRLERSADVIRAAAEGFAGCGARLQQAAALVDLGAEIRRSGRPREARTVLHDGLRLAAETDGLAIAARGRDELRLAGGRPSIAAQNGTGPLTPGERRVAERAAAGQTNREIADGLFLTVKSIEWHLGNVYRKLGIAGRSGLPAALGGSAAG